VPRSVIHDDRLGAGIPVAAIIQPTFTIPHGCTCTWTVVRPGTGFACLSQLRYRSAMCPVQRQHKPPEVPHG